MKDDYSLLPGKELEALVSLSKGIPFLLDRCDLVSPDTSFILYGIGSFYNYDIKSSGLTSKYFNLKGIFSIYKNISSGQNTRVIKEKLRDIIDENFLRRDVLSDYLLNQALSKENFLFTEQAYQEVRKKSGQFMESIEKMLGRKTRILPPGFKKRHFPKSNRRKDPSQEFLLISKGFEETVNHLEDYECASEMRKILEEVEKRIEGKKNIENGITTIGINDIFGNVFNNNKILLSTERFRLKEGRFDEDIIDTILSNGDKVGIISCDYKDFRQKIQTVMEFRKKHRLPNPEVFLLEPRKGLVSYDLMEFSNTDFSLRYLGRA